MTQIEFYVLPADTAEGRLVLACRLADQAVQQNQKVLINAGTSGDCARLDDLLWTFSQGSFLPHRRIASPAEAPGDEPVLIGQGVTPERSARQLLINLADDVPEFFSGYERVAELVDGNEERRRLGRERFKFYRERGYAPATHQL